MAETSLSQVTEVKMFSVLSALSVCLAKETLVQLATVGKNRAPILMIVLVDLIEITRIYAD
jgi:hypothetical protein